MQQVMHSEKPAWDSLGSRMMNDFHVCNALATGEHLRLLGSFRALWAMNVFFAMPAWFFV